MIPTLTPAYGRDYKSKAAAEADLRAGKDFVWNSFQGSTYCNLSDLQARGVRQVQLRYQRQTKVAVVKL